jgi:hypothetical protein
MNGTFARLARHNQSLSDFDRPLPPDWLVIGVGSMSGSFTKGRDFAVWLGARSHQSLVVRIPRSFRILGRVFYFRVTRSIERAPASA